MNSYANEHVYHTSTLIYILSCCIVQINKGIEHINSYQLCILLNATKQDKSLRSIYKRKKTGTVTMLKLEAMVSIFLFCIEI